jgi:hypothetical protein
VFLLFLVVNVDIFSFLVLLFFELFTNFTHIKQYVNIPEEESFRRASSLGSASWGTASGLEATAPAATSPESSTAHHHHHRSDLVHHSAAPAETACAVPW